MEQQGEDGNGAEQGGFQVSGAQRNVAVGDQIEFVVQLVALNIHRLVDEERGAEHQGQSGQIER